MDRTLYYTAEQLRSFDLLWFERDAMTGVGNLTQDLLGSTITVVGGVTATADSPPDMSFTLGAGRVYQQAPVDASAFGILPSDSLVITQQGWAASQKITLTTAALSAGQSQWVLIEAGFAPVDAIRTGDPTGGVLYYFNSSNPAQPFQGPNNTGAAQNTVRQGVISIKAVYGSPATTGSEAPPNVDSGYVGLYLIDLTFGQTQISQGEILVAGPSVGANVPTNYPRAPFLAGLLSQHHKGTPGQAPQIDLTSEVQHVLPLANLPASSSSGGGLGTFKLYNGNPNGNVAGNANVNGASDFCFDTAHLTLYVCSTTGTASTAVWSPASGQGVQFAGGTSTGTANAQVVSSVTPGGFTLTSGYSVTFTPGVTNTGDTFLQVAGTANTECKKVSGGSLVSFTGGEFTATDPVTVIFNGTYFVLQSSVLGACASLNLGLYVKNDGSGNLTLNLGATGALGNDGTGALAVKVDGVGVGVNGSDQLALVGTGVTAGTYAGITIGTDGRVTAAGAIPAFWAREEQNSGVSSVDVLATNAWTRRTLNTSKLNTISGASIGGSQITLPAGTYEVEAWSLAYNTDGTMLRLYNNTAASIIFQGRNASVQPGSLGNAVYSFAGLKGRFTLSVSSVIELDMYCNGGAGVAGYPVSSGVNEVYSEIFIKRMM